REEQAVPSQEEDGPERRAGKCPVWFLADKRLTTTVQEKKGSERVESHPGNLSGRLPAPFPPALPCIPPVQPIAASWQTRAGAPFVPLLRALPPTCAAGSRSRRIPASSA